MLDLLMADNAAVAWGIAAALGLLAVGLACIAANRQAVYRRAHEAERSLHDLYENTSDGVFRSTLDGRMISANPALARLNGFASEEEMLNEVNDIAGRWYVEPGRREEIHRRLLEEGRISGVVSEVFRYKTRERIWIEENTRLVRDWRTGVPRYYDGTVREVTETVRRLQLQERFEKIAAVSDGCLYQMRVHPDGRVETLYISVAVERIFGVDAAASEADPAYVLRMVHPADRDRLIKSFSVSNDTLAPRRIEYRIIAPDGAVKWISAHSVPERQTDGSLLMHGYAEEITERKLAEERVQRLAFYDQLTGLPNRTAFIERLNAALDVCRAGGTCLAVFFVDLDQFKMLNDTKGHHAGDTLLVLVARRLEEVVGPEGVIARLGGDEFVAMVPDPGGKQETRRPRLIELADRIQAALARPFLIEGLPFRTSASIGVSCFSDGVGDAVEYIKRADLAMYEAKASGRAHTCFFVPAMQERLNQRVEMSNALHEALDREELTLVCQPQVQDGVGLTGVELLMRWRSPTHGDVSPSEFVPLAERAGLSGLLDTYVLERGCLLLKRWAALPSFRDLTVAVNVSCRHLRSDFARSLATTIAATGIAPDKLMVELTEHVMLDDTEAVARVIEELKALGVGIALDDFGTGYSSLTNLKMLPIDCLKIDLSFVRDLETDANDRVIVQTIINIARSLGKQVIAEGVETDIQALLLRQFGCRAFQGYLFGRPMAIDAFENWIAQHGGDVFYGRPEAGGPASSKERNPTDGRPSRAQIRQ